MRYIPHTKEDVQEMLSVCGVEKVEDLFSSIPPDARLGRKLNLPPPLSEIELVRSMKKTGGENKTVNDCLSFLGAGCYHHFVPAAVSEIASRSEWLTPYTPYQPEISQGTLQAMFEYQSLICALTGMDVANASHYDGATATAEAAIMAVQKTGRKRVIVAEALHPEYRAAIKTLLKPRGCRMIEVPALDNGATSIVDMINVLVDGDAAAMIIQSPNFFGVIEDIAVFEKSALFHGALLAVAVAEPVSLGILKPPGAFGADIVTAEGQALGGGLSFGGPGLGIFATRKENLRSMPGRIAGQTVDENGRRGFVLTMATREQHIRREKATSNICSNEALMALRAAVHLALLGKEGLRKLAEMNLANALYLKERLAETDGIELAFSGPTFNEFVIKTKKDANDLLRSLLEKNIFAGVLLERWYPRLRNHLLICTTECHTKDDLDRFAEELARV